VGFKGELFPDKSQRRLSRSPRVAALSNADASNLKTAQMKNDEQKSC